MIPKRYRRHLKRVLCPIPRSYGKEFGPWRRLLEETQWWTPEQLLERQNRELRRLVQHAYQNVPYYRDLLDARGLGPNDIRSKEDLDKIPFLTKELIKTNAERLKARNIPAPRTEFHTTGGTTGTPLGVVIESRTNSIRLAFEWRFYNWAGYHFGDTIAVLRGRQVNGFEKGKRWEYDPYERYLILSAFDMTDHNMAEHVEKLQEFKPKFIRGYPSNLALLARFALDHGTRLNPSGTLQGVLTSSETLYPFQRGQISEAFQAPVFDLYGNTEQAGRFGECERHEGYHDFVEHSVIELVDQDESGMGEIVATSLINYAMPLIRYKTGDSARRSQQRCSCGRGLPLLAGLEGRSQDVALLKDGTPVSLTGFFFAVHVPEMSFLRKIQFQQETPGHLRALVVKGPHYQEGACEVMLRRMNENLARPFKIEVEFVEDIAGTKAGKHKFFVSLIRSGDGH